jgi:hypothetical protein
MGASSARAPAILRETLEGTSYYMVWLYWIKPIATINNNTSRFNMTLLACTSVSTSIGRTNAADPSYLLKL